MVLLFIIVHPVISIIHPVICCCSSHTALRVIYNKFYSIQDFYAYLFKRY